LEGRKRKGRHIDRLAAAHDLLADSKAHCGLDKINTRKEKFYSIRVDPI